MTGPIRADLEETEQCKTIDMIKYLFAFCASDGSKEVPACDEQLLECAFEDVKEIANRRGTTLERELSKL